MTDIKEIIEKIRNKVLVVQESKKIMRGTDEIASNIKRLISRNALVPVICEDMYEYEDPVTKKRQTLHSYIVEKIITSFYNRGIRIELTEDEMKDIIREGYYGMSLLRAKCGKVIYEDIFNSVYDEDNNIFDGICLKEEVYQFLLACHFPLIVTTNCFPILEKELEFKYMSYWNELETKNDSPLPDRCIYHLFGEAKLENTNWGYNDKQVLSFLRSSFSSDYSLKNLTSIIGNKNSRQTLFVLGNDCPDWLFRFILTPIYGGDVYDDRKGFYISDEGHIEEGSLNQFLSDIKFEKESQLINVLNKITAKIKNSTVSNTKKTHEKKYDFFVAHAGDAYGESIERDKASKLVKRLRDNGLKVWVDYENIKDGQYWQRIISALKESAYFMPLITEKYIMKTCTLIKQQELLNSLNISEISITPEETRKINDSLEGVQTELLIASRWLELNPQDTYSLPVISANETVFDEPLTKKRVENWSNDSRRLPQNLFWGMTMYEFDAQSPENFVLDWSRYKSII